MLGVGQFVDAMCVCGMRQGGDVSTPDLRRPGPDGGRLAPDLYPRWSETRFPQAPGAGIGCQNTRCRPPGASVNGVDATFCTIYTILPIVSCLLSLASSYFLLIFFVCK